MSKFKLILVVGVIGLGIYAYSAASSMTWEEGKYTFIEKCKDSARKSIKEYQFHSKLDEFAESSCNCMFERVKKKYKTPFDMGKDLNAEKFGESSALACAEENKHYFS